MSCNLLFDRLLKYLSILFFINVMFAVFFSAKIYADNKFYSSVKELVTTQKTIRIFMDNSPGYGNQTSSLNIMVRLRQMGFNGTFELIYGNVTSDKIFNLFNLPKNTPDIYYDEKHNIKFIKIKSHLDRVFNNSIEMLPLGITGGDDSGECGVARKDGINLDMYSPLCIDPANFYGVNIFIEMDPYVSNEPLSSHRTTFYLFDPLASGKPYFPYQKDSYNKYFVMPVTNLVQAKAYLEDDQRGRTLLAERPALKTFINGLENHKFNVLPVYGCTVQITKMCPECFPGNILQIITGARYAQLNGPRDFYKPLIIPVFYDYQKESMQIMKIIGNDDWGQNSQPGEEQAKKIIKNLFLSQAFSIADIKNVETIQRIKNLKPGEVLLLSMGGALPKDVFDGIYNYTDTNIWPQIREGANTFNSLILTGRPHIRCHHYWEIGFDLVTDPALKARLEKFYQHAGICAGMDTWISNPDTYRTLGELIIEANDKQSSFSHYFQRIREEALKPENDRIYYALEGAMELLNKSF